MLRGKGKKGGREGGRKRDRGWGAERGRQSQGGTKGEKMGGVCRREGAGITKESIQTLLTRNI